MPADLPAPFILLLHEGGWDEVLMVAAGLIVAYVVIVWTGRRRQDEDEDELYGDENLPDSSSGASGDQPPRQHS
jgi:hypothetical protein